MRIHYRRELTRHEMMLAYYVYKGMNNTDISKSMNNGRGTVRSSLRNIYTKLGFSGDEARVKLATWVARQVMRSVMIDEGFSYLIGDMVFEQENVEKILS